MGYEFLVARRYLRSRHSVRFITLINVLSIVGIGVGVAALVVVLSVFNGFTSVVTNVLVSFDPHIRIEKSGGLSDDDLASVTQFLGKEKEVVGVSPFVTGKAMVVSRLLSKVVVVRGVDPQTFGSVSGVKEKIVLGAFEIPDTGQGTVVIGLTLADRLSGLVGSDVSLVSPYAGAATMNPFASVPIEKLRITGIFESNNRDYDANFAFVPLHVGRRLFNMADRYSGIEVRLRSIDATESVATALREQLPTSFVVQTWYDLHRDLYSVMKIERWIGYILVCLIIAVATFNLLGTMMMSVIEKRRDLGVMRAMGATKRSLSKIYFYQGAWVGFIGTSAGVILGLLLVFLQSEFHLYPLDPTVYIIPAIPVEVHFMDFVLVGLAAFGLAALAAYLPARRAASIVPIEAIRWE